MRLPKLPPAEMIFKNTSRMLLGMSLFSTLWMGTFSKVHAAPPIEGQKINHVIGLYVGPNGLNILEHNIDKIMEINGFSSNSYFIESISRNLGLTHFNDMVPNPKLQQLAAQVRQNFKKFFRGITIKDSHEFEVNVEGIDISGEWEKVGVKVLGNSTLEDPNYKSGVRLLLEAKARQLRISVDKARVKDLQHPFLGDIGVDGFFLELVDGEKNPFTVNLVTELFLKENSGFDVKMGEIGINIKDVGLNTGFRTPMALPTVEVRINGRRAFLKNDEIEKIIRGQLPKLIEGLRKSLKQNIDEKLIPLAKEKATEFLAKPHVEINEMEPVGLEVGKRDVNYRWGIFADKVEVMTGPILHVGLGGYVYDPKFRNDIAVPQDSVAQNPPLAQTFKNVQFDLALAINQGLFNRMLQYGHRRMYFSNMKTKSGDKLDLVTYPKVNMIGKGTAQKPVTMRISTKYPVTGIQKIFVRSPIEITMDLEVEFNKTADGKYPMTLKGIDVDTAHVPDKFIRIFKGLVRSQIKKKVVGISKAIKGMVLSENLPIPQELGGIKLKMKELKIDPNGHIVVFMNIDLENN